MVGDLTDPELREDTWLDLWAATTADCPEEASLLKLLIEALSLKIERAKEVGNFSEAHKMEELRSKIERKYGGSKDSRKDCE
jgi:hypothetical protein